MLFCVCTELLFIFSIFSSRNFPISAHSKAASTFRGYLMIDTLEMAANALVSTEVCFKHLPYFALLLRKLSSVLSFFID